MLHIDVKRRKQKFREFSPITAGTGCKKVFFSKKGKMCEARIIGRVSMDNIICDVTDVPELRVGDFGALIFDEYTLDDIARDAGTISYEVVSRLGKNTRFERKYTLK